VAGLSTAAVDGWSPQGAVAELSTEECWLRLGLGTRGRLGVSVDDSPGIYPVDYAVDDGTILFRTGAGEKLDRLRSNDRVAFEVDGETERRAWSVVVTGVAHELPDEPTPDSAATDQLPPWAPVAGYVYIRVVPTAVRGMRWEPRHVIARD
jgi:uncharacterized protein